MGVSLSKVELPISGFFEASRLTLAELGQRLVDLGEFSCRCNDDKLLGWSIDAMVEMAAESRRDGVVGEFPHPIVVARVSGVNGLVGDGFACISPPCFCEAIKSFLRRSSILARYLSIAIMPLRRTYDLSKPRDELDLKALVSSICSVVGNREILELFVKYYIVERASKDGDFRAKIIEWLRGDTERPEEPLQKPLPQGLVKEFHNYLKGLGLRVSETTVRRVLHQVFITSRNELLRIFGVETRGEDVKVHCIRPEVVSAILGKLGLQPSSDYLKVLCMLSKQEVEGLGKLVRDNAEAREKVRELLVGSNASVDGLRELVREYLGASEVGEEAKVDGTVVGEAGVRSETGGEAGEVGAMPRAREVGSAPRVGAEVGGVIKADVEGGGFRGVHRVEVRCFGVNAGATEECRLLNLLAGFINDGDFSVVPEVKRLLDVVVSRRGPNIGGRDGYAAIRGCVDVELRNLGVENGEEVLELITREGSLRELGRALGGSVGDWASLNETILKLARQRVRDARGIEAINTLLEIIKALKDLGPEGLGEHSWVIVRVMKAVKDGNWYSLITDLATELELNKEELARHLFGGA
jgi:hypothetical protein